MLVVVIRTVAVAAAEMAVAHWALEWTAINGRHRHSVHTVRVLQGTRGDGVQLVHTGHLDVEHSLVAVGAAATRVTQLDALCGVFLIEQTYFGHDFRVLASHEAIVIVLIVSSAGVDLQGRSLTNICYRFALGRHCARTHSSTNVENVGIIGFHL